MRVAGMLLLVSGWVIALAAVILLPSSLARIAFLSAGFGIEALGLGLSLRSQQEQREGHQ